MLKFNSKNPNCSKNLVLSGYVELEELKLSRRKEPYWKLNVCSFVSFRPSLSRWKEN